MARAIECSACLAAAGLVSVLVACGSSRQPLVRGGPLNEPGPAHTSAFTTSIGVGRRFTYTDVLFVNHGRRRVVLDRLKLIGLTPHLRVFGPYVTTVGECLATPTCSSNPEVGWSRKHARRIGHRVAGFVVNHGFVHQSRQVRPPTVSRHDVRMIVTLKPLRKGKFGFRAVDVYYHVGKSRFVSRDHYAIKVCAPILSRGACR